MKNKTLRSTINNMQYMKDFNILTNQNFDERKKKNVFEKI